jgi:hypothetical protein
MALIGASLGAILAVNDLGSLGPSHFAAWAVLTVEAPATFIVYIYLSFLAAGLADAPLARRLRWLGFAAAFLAISPLAALELSWSLHTWRVSWTAALLGGAFVTVSMCISLMTCCALLKLAWLLLQNITAETGSKPSA